MQPRKPISRSKTIACKRASNGELTGTSPANRNRVVKPSTANSVDPVQPENAMKNKRASKQDPSKLPGMFCEKPHAHALFALLDVDGDKAIDMEEWKTFHELIQTSMPADKFHLSSGMLDHRFADQNGDGTVSRQEWNEYVDALYEVCGHRVWYQAGSHLITQLQADQEKQKEKRNQEKQKLKQETARTQEHDAIAWIEDEGIDWMNMDSGSLVEFSELQKDTLKRYFELRDLDSSGALSLQEVSLVIDDIGRFPQLGTQDADTLQKLLEKADKDHSKCLEFNEFAGFLQAYYRSVYERVFYEHAEDKQVLVSRLRPILNAMCEAGFDVSVDDLQNLAERDADGILDFEEFCVLMRSYRDVEFQHLSKTAGFRKATAEMLLSMFEEADADGNGTLQIKETVPLIEKVEAAKLDQPGMLKAFAQLFLRMDKDDSMSMDFLEFLTLLAVWGKELSRRNKRVTGKQSSFACGKTKEELAKAKADARTFRIASLHANIDGEGVEDEAKKLRLSALSDDLENEVLALRWRLSVSEVRALRESFEFIDLDGSGEVERGELNSLMGLLGCQATTALAKAALAQSLDEAKQKGDLDFVGVVGVVQSFQAAVIQAAFAANRTSGGSVPVQSIGKVFHSTGQYLGKEQVHALLQELNIDTNTVTEVSEEMFTKIVEFQNAKRSRQWQSNWGFSDKEVTRVHRICTEHGLSDKGQLDIDKVDGVLQDMLSKDAVAAFVDSMKKALMRTDRSMKGTLSLEEVLLVARHLCNQKNLEDSKVAKALGLEPEVVDQFRDVFSMADKDNSGSVSYKEIKSVLSELGVVKTYKQRQNMNLVVEDVLGHEVEQDSEEELSFSQFLQILDQLEKKK